MEYSSDRYHPEPGPPPRVTSSHSRHFTFWSAGDRNCTYGLSPAMGIMQQGPNWLLFTHRQPETTLCQHLTITSHLYLEEHRHCQRNSEAKRLIAGFCVVFQSLSDCLSSVFWGFTKCFGRNTALFCAQYIKSPSQHLAGILLMGWDTSTKIQPWFFVSSQFGF